MQQLGQSNMVESMQEKYQENKGKWPHVTIDDGERM